MPVIPNATITRRRFAAFTVNAAGEMVPGSATDVTGISVSVQAPDGDDMQILPEGTRAVNVRKVYSPVSANLRTVDQHAQLPADHVLIDSVEYQVQHVWPWKPGALIPHYKALVVRLQEVAP